MQHPSLDARIAYNDDVCRDRLISDSISQIWFWVTMLKVAGAYTWFSTRDSSHHKRLSEFQGNCTYLLIWHWTTIARMEWSIYHWMAESPLMMMFAVLISKVIAPAGYDLRDEIVDNSGDWVSIGASELCDMIMYSKIDTWIASIWQCDVGWVYSHNNT